MIPEDDFEEDDHDFKKLFNTFRWHATSEYHAAYANKNNEDGSFFVSSLCKIH